MDREHSKSQVIAEMSTGVLTHVQKKSLLNMNQEFCVFNSFISKIQPKMVKIALGQSD